jgi:SAM-dependent methyltransferase
MADPTLTEITETGAWADRTHAEVFDGLHIFPPSLLRMHYEGFNEGRLLAQYAQTVQGTRFYEVGCATGELYRYIRSYHQRFEYHGFDISEPAIARARQKYPDARFNHYHGDLARLREEVGETDVVWCRDVVLHQSRPLEFLDRLIELTRDTLVLRLRTRDSGATVTDTRQSCQLHWDRHWVPYIVLNTEEMLERISSHGDVGRIVVARSYEVLGGHNYRYLPKELYFSSARAAETAVLVQKRPRPAAGVEVIYMDRQDRPRPVAERLLKIGVARFHRAFRRR